MQTPDRPTRGSARHCAAALLALLLCGGCGTSPESQDARFESNFQTRTNDGLYRLRTRAVSAAFGMPGADLAAYHSVAVGPTTVVPRQQEPQGEGGPRRRHAPLNARTEAELRATVRGAIVDAFAAEESFALVEARGPGILWVTGNVLDFDMNLRTAPGGERDFGGELGELTLVLDVRDSDTGAPLLRLLDRRDLRLQQGDQVDERGSGAQWTHLRTSVADWAGIVTQEIARIRKRGIAYAPGASPESAPGS